jgi:tRNA pseudouridine38-40 synthase
LFGYVHITNSFNTKKFCDCRRYVYLLPVFVLDPSMHPDHEAVMASMGSGIELERLKDLRRRPEGVNGSQLKFFT